MKDKLVKNEEEWREALSPEQFFVCREKGTEPPFSGKYVHNMGKGVYVWVCCGHQLFSSEHKFEACCGWPSFYRPLSETAIGTGVDYSHGMTRTEVLCSRCDAHLGHVFNDGPLPTGPRYCINSVALQFVPSD